MHGAVRRPVVGVLVVHVVSHLVVGGVGTVVPTTSLHTSHRRHSRCVRCVASRLVIIACIASRRRRHLWWRYDQVRGRHETGARERVGQTARDSTTDRARGRHETARGVGGPDAGRPGWAGTLVWIGGWGTNLAFFLTQRGGWAQPGCTKGARRGGADGRRRCVCRCAGWYEAARGDSASWDGRWANRRVSVNRSGEVLT